MRTFVELVERYVDPELCPYPEYKGKPHYSIKYIENGEEYVGYSTYSLQVMSGFLKKYFIQSALKKQEQDGWIPCNEKPEYDFQNVLVRWRDKRKGCEKDYYIFEGYVVRGIWCGLFEDADISDFEPVEWKPLEPYMEGEA